MQAGGSSERVQQGLLRVERAYEGRWGVRPKSHAHHSATCGLVEWSRCPSTFRWPAWVQQGSQAVASVGTPLGVERITQKAPADAAIEVARVLRSAPRRILDLTPPFVLGCIDADADRLDLFTDALGVGRLFEVRTAWGRVWSNRPVAAIKFAGLPLVPDPLGWSQMAVADELFGEVTPLRGVRVVRPATRVSWRRSRLAVQSLDTVSSQLSYEGELDDLVEEAAADLKGTASSIGRWFDGTPTVDLSGGRDSRLVAAAFLASGTAITLHSHDAVPGDLVIAKELVGLLGREVEHRIEHTKAGGTGAVQMPPGMDAAYAWHEYAEGLRPSSFLLHRTPRTLDVETNVVVGGVGGEAAHSYYGPLGRVGEPQGLQSELLRGIERASEEEDVLKACADRIVRRHCTGEAVLDPYRQDLFMHVLSVLRRISRSGVPSSAVLDHYYVLEGCAGGVQRAKGMVFVRPC
ncbi:Uncharacterised protein [Dermatophilus congolensis]|uniref:Asparagine synthase (Glutamine-hydrolyzing) n=1 Tax=Dermatophilus congolensis TaxID=1863 RepID=A0AA46H010_9MICO|nr:Uncharacterised protein [Dermatophilus congolensis]